MTNTVEWNTCAALATDESYADALKQYDALLEQGLDPFQHMLQMQFGLQVALAEKSPEHNPRPDSLKTLGQKFDWLRENKQAFDDEYSEVIDALPGMSMPGKDRSAVWKRWKSKYNEVRDMSFDNLTEDDIKELKFELTDMTFFFLNMFFALDMDAKELFVYYWTKCAENHRRAATGY